MKLINFLLNKNQCNNKCYLIIDNLDVYFYYIITIT